MTEMPFQGPDIPIPHDMPEMPDDLTIIARLIDANCRAYNEEYGWHLDSRCLSHYNEGIVRLAQAGVVDLKPVKENGQTKMRMTRSGEPEPVLYEEVTDAPAQAVRVRASYVPFEKMTDRPTSDPIWKLQMDEMARMRQELNSMRAAQARTAQPTVDGMHAPADVATAPISTPDPMAAPMTVDVPMEEVPEWMLTAPETPQPDPATMPGAPRPIPPETL
jgi:hypothetical protein